MDWEEVKTVLALVRQGSLAGAGADLGVNYTTIARRVRRAETTLGTALFERLADGYEATEAGRLVADHAARMEAEELALQRKLMRMADDVSGPLIITAPQLVIAYAMAPALQVFTETYPGVDLTVRATNDLLDLSRREADLAIRISADPGDSLTGLRLCAQETAAFGTPLWAETFAQDPSAQIDWITYVAYQNVPQGVTAPGARVRYRFDDMMAIAGAVQAGLGVARMPLFLGRAMGLVQLPLLAPQPYADIWLVGHADVWPGARVKAFRDIIVPFMRREAHRFVS